MNIIVIGDLSSSNLGDPILTHSAEYLINLLCKDSRHYSVTVFDLAGRKDNIINVVNNNDKRGGGKRNPSPTFEYYIANIKSLIKWFLSDRKIFLQRLQKVCPKNCLICIAGGALISKSLFYALRLHEIVSFAHRINARVVFNAVGIEKHTGVNVSYLIAKRFLRAKEVISFSTRDHIEEIPRLCGRKDFLKQISDPGIWAAEAYNVKKTVSDTVGIGVISSQAYRSVCMEKKEAIEVSTESLISFWGSIIEYLNSQKVEWKVFTNGGPKDYQIACQLLEKYGYSIQEKLMPRPEKPEELVQQIAQFKIVMAHRLHALIISASLKIPFVAIAWSDKIFKFAEKINNPFVFWPIETNVSIIGRILNGEIEYYKEFENYIDYCKLESKKSLQEFIE